MVEVIEVPVTEVVVIEGTTPETVEVINHTLEVVEVAVQGPAGPQGIPGPAGSSTLTRMASGAIGGHRFVIGQADGSAIYADATILGHAGKVLGITLAAVNDGETLDIVRSGKVVLSGWAWDTGLPIYLGSAGVPTQTVPIVGFSQIVGFAESPTSLFVDLREPIILN